MRSFDLRSRLHPASGHDARWAPAGGQGRPLLGVALVVAVAALSYVVWLLPERARLDEALREAARDALQGGSQAMRPAADPPADGAANDASREAAAA